MKARRELCSLLLSGLLLSVSGCALFRPPAVSNAPAGDVTAGGGRPGAGGAPADSSGLPPGAPETPGAGVAVDTAGAAVSTGSTGAESDTAAASLARAVAGTTGGSGGKGGAAPRGPASAPAAARGPAPTPAAAQGPETAPATPLRPAPAAAPDTTAPPPLFDEAAGWSLEARRMLGQEDVAGLRHILLDVTLTQAGTLITAPRGYYYPASERTALGAGVRLTDSTLTVLADSALYDRGPQRMDAYGGVTLDDRDVHLSGQTGTYDRILDRMTLRGSVHGRQGERRIRGDDLVYSRRTGLIEVTGHATIEDPGHNSTVHGRRVVYEVRTGVATVAERPVLDWSRGTNQVHIEGDRMRFLDDGNRFEVTGTVVARQGRQTATADSACFLDREAVGTFHGSPRVADPEGDLTGDSLALHFDENALRTAVMVGGATVIYVPTDPDLAGERSIVRGDSLTIFFEDDRMKELRALGSPSIDYRPSLADSASGTGRVAAQADTVRVILKDQAVDRVEVTGRASGRYLYASRARADSVDRVDYAASRITFRIPQRMIELRGEGQTDYHELTLKAEQIDFDATRETLEASPRPVLIDKTRPAEQELVGRRVRFDIATSRGTVYHGRTQYDQGYIFADSLRKVSDRIFDANDGQYTTCDLISQDMDPHFHFLSRRMKVYLGDKVVAKPVVLYIGNIPVFALPFYVFSIRKGRHSGLLMPRFEFGFNSTSGRFFENLGYYWAASDYTDYTFRTAYRENPGVLIGETTARYAKRDLLDGQLDVGHAWGLDRGLNQVTLRHNHTLGEGARLTASGEFADPEFRSLRGLGTGIGQRVDRQLRSTFGLSKSWRELGLSLNVTGSQEKAMDADRNDGVDEIVLNRSFPGITASLNTRSLGRKATGDRPGRLPWASTITYSLSFSGYRQEQQRESTTRTAARVDTTGGVTTVIPGDTTTAIVSTTNTNGRWRLGVRDTRRVLGFLNLSPSLDLTEHWVDREYSAADTVKGFRRAAVYSLAMTGGTTFYGTFFPRIGPLVALRHVLSPSVSLVYNPEFRNLTYPDANGLRRNRFPGVGATESQVLTYSLDNRFQAKVKSGDDLKRTDLLTWQLGGSYNLLAAHRGEAHPASDISSAMDIHRVKNVGLNFRSTHDPYRQLRFLTLSLQGSVGFHGNLPGGTSSPEAPARGPTPGTEATDGFDTTPSIYRGPTGGGQETGDALSWNASFGLSYSGSRDSYDRMNTQANLNSSLDVRLTKNWQMTYSSLYAFETKQFNYQRLELSRALHCWEAVFSYSATPFQNEFYFRISVKAMPEIKFERGPGLGAFDSITSLTPGGSF